MAGFPVYYPVGTVPVLRGNHVVVGRHVNVVDYIEEDTRHQTAYCREGIAYHRDEAPLALADAVNDDVGRNKQQVAGKEFYLAVVEIQAQIAVQTEEHHQEIDLDAFFFVGK